jgi:asparagine synthase (glutamine-hydrolysing)
MLQEAARAFVPPSVLNHRKQGFASPMASWLRGDLKPLVDRELSSTTIDGGGVLRSDTVRALVTAHEERRSLNNKQLFALLMFQRWTRSAVSP